MILLYSSLYICFIYTYNIYLCIHINTAIIHIEYELGSVQGELLMIREDTLTVGCE